MTSFDLRSGRGAELAVVARWDNSMSVMCSRQPAR